MPNKADAAWIAAGRKRIEIKFAHEEEEKCEVCLEPLWHKGTVKHHVLPVFSRHVFGFTLQTWWNCCVRHKHCECRDHHDVCLTLDQAGKEKCRSMAPEIGRVAREILKSYAVLPITPDWSWPEGIFGQDPHGLVVIIAHIPEDQLEKVPHLLRKAVLQVLGQPRKIRERSHKNRKPKSVRIREAQMAAIVQFEAEREIGLEKSLR